jgi:hypothetical protein
MNIVYYIKEYFGIIFYFLVIFNIILSVIYSKSKKTRKKRSNKRSNKRKNRKGGGLGRLFLSYAQIILCFLTFGLWCPDRGTQYRMWWDTRHETVLFPFDDSDDGSPGFLSGAMKKDEWWEKTPP